VIFPGAGFRRRGRSGPRLNTTRERGVRFAVASFTIRLADRYQRI
jgi:hypothetical protein